LNGFDMLYNAIAMPGTVLTKTMLSCR